MARVLDKGNPRTVKEASSVAPYRVAVTPSDTIDLAVAPKGLFVGVAGNITVLDKDGVSRLFRGVPAGTTLICSCKRVMATGTAATDIMAEY